MNLTTPGKIAVLLVATIVFLSSVVVIQRIQIDELSSSLTCEGCSPGMHETQVPAGYAHVTKYNSAFYSFVVQPSYSVVSLVGNLSVTSFELRDLFSRNYTLLLTLRIFSAQQYNRWLAGNGTYVWATEFDLGGSTPTSSTSTTSLAEAKCHVRFGLCFDAPIAGNGIFYQVVGATSSLQTSDHVNVNVQLVMIYTA